MNGSTERGVVAGRLNELLSEAGQAKIDPTTARKFEAFFYLLWRWNSRINLTAVRDEVEILRRHFVESIACARALPGGIRRLLDFGSGAGFPGLPIALCRPELQVTLTESQGKKAAFLREVVRTLGIPVDVRGGRAETLEQSFDCVSLRAVDRMELAVQTAAGLVRLGGWLAVLTTDQKSEAVCTAAGLRFSWKSVTRLPGGSHRILLLGCREG